MKKKSFFCPHGGGGGSLVGAALILAVALVTLGCPQPTESSKKTPPGDVTALTAAITAAEALVNETAATDDEADAVPEGEHYVTLAEKAALQTAITAAKTREKSGGSQAEINSALAALNAAMTTFTEARESHTGTGVPVDKTALIDAITEATRLIRDTAVGERPEDIPVGMEFVTAAKKEALQQALTTAEAVRARTSVTQEEIDAAETALLDAIDVFCDAMDYGTNAHYSFTVSFNLNYTGAGDPPASITVEDYPTLDDAGLSLPVPGWRDHYEFAGWYTTADGSGQPFTATTSITHDVTLYAKWLAAYNIIYHLNGGVITGQTAEPNGDVRTTYVSGTELTLPEPAYSGARFDGWYTDSAFTSAIVTAIPADATGDKEFWAKWKKVEYDLQFNGSLANTSSGGLPPSVYSFKEEPTVPRPIQGGGTIYETGLDGRQSFKVDMRNGFIRLDDDRQNLNDSGTANTADPTTAFNYNQSFTVAFWVKVNSAGLNGNELVLFSNKNMGGSMNGGMWFSSNTNNGRENPGLAFYIDGTGNNRSIKLNSKSVADSAALGGTAGITITESPLDTWVHIAAVYDKADGKVRYYANGIKIGEETTNLADGIGSGYASYIGSSAGNAAQQYTRISGANMYAMNFNVQDFVLKGGALSDAEVAGLSWNILGTLTAPVLTCAAGTGDAQITYSWTAAAQAGVVYNLYIAQGTKTAAELKAETPYLVTTNAVTSPAVYVGSAATEYSVLVTAARGSSVVESSVVTVTSSGVSPNPVLTFETGTNAGEIRYSFTAGQNMSGQKLYVAIGSHTTAAAVKSNGFLIYTATSTEETAGVLTTVVKGNPGLAYSAVVEALNTASQTVYSNVVSNVAAAGTYDAATNIAPLYKTVAASSTWPSTPSVVAASGVDGILTTRWSAGSGSNGGGTVNNTTWVLSPSRDFTVTFGLPVQVAKAGLLDAADDLVAFKVQYLDDSGQWNDVFSHDGGTTSIGGKGPAAATGTNPSSFTDMLFPMPFTENDAPVTVQATQIRLVITKAKIASCTFWEFLLHGPDTP
jgi:uncharacterized repeat protein (TIGR02543 family)